MILASTIPIVDSVGDLPTSQPWATLPRPLLQVSWLDDYGGWNNSKLLAD